VDNIWKYSLMDEGFPCCVCSRNYGGPSFDDLAPRSERGLSHEQEIWARRALKKWLRS